MVGDRPIFRRGIAALLDFYQGAFNYPAAPWRAIGTSQSGGKEPLLTILATLELTGMSIKSDKWIRRMAEQHGMIEPFEPGQIRHNADGQKIDSFALARTMKYFRIPRNVLTICLGKSTYARCGIIVNVTPFEPEWEGYVTLEFSNTTPLPAKIYAGEGCAQVLFFESDKDDVCEVSYKDRGGKYQGQVGVTLPKA